MKTASIAEFRRNAKRYIDAVERGERVRISRHGRIVGEIVPASQSKAVSWKTAALELNIRGLSLSAEILKDRRESAR